MKTRDQTVDEGDAYFDMSRRFKEVASTAFSEIFSFAVLACAYSCLRRSSGSDVGTCGAAHSEFERAGIHLLSLLKMI